MNTVRDKQKPRIERVKLTNNGNGNGNGNAAIRARNGNGETVTIASKMQLGLILRIYKVVDGVEHGPNGGKVVSKISVPIPGQEFVVQGCALGRAADFRMKELVGGFVLTPGCPKELWDRWMEQTGRHMDCVKNELIFAYRKPDDAKAHAKSNKDELSGLEPISPTGDKRNKNHGEMRKVQQFDKQA